MISNTQDTITAISTPPGEGGIGIVRISGPDALSIALNLFRPAFNPKKLESHKAKVGKLVKFQSEEVVDKVIFLPMLAPNSYTAEDTVEFHCHGGRMPLSLILKETLSLGARMAEPGEFTKRAFLNGRIDLTQAEAVISLIKSTSEGSLRSAVRQLDGGLKRVLTEFREELIGLLARIEAEIDFPEEEIEPILYPEIETGAEKVLEKMDRLGKTYEQGKVLRDGVETAIVGRPNVGKSSLLNVLLDFDKAIVASIPGTTRDIIEEAVNIRGITLKIMDTAGIRTHGDEIEKEGIRRTRKALEGADLVLAVFDISQELTPEDLETVKAVKGKKVIPVLNKCDLGKGLDTGRLKKLLPHTTPVQISAKKKEGIDALEEAIYQTIWDSKTDLTENVLITRMRHEEKIQKAIGALRGVLRSLQESLPPEFVAADLRSALDWLGEITGESYSEEVLEKIFSEFCIGK